MAVIDLDGGSQQWLSRREVAAAPRVMRTRFLAGHEVQAHEHASDATLTRDVYPGAG